MVRNPVVPLTQLVYALAIGGSETLARRLALGLNGLGRYACSVYAVHEGGPLEDVLRRDGIPCIAFGRRGKWDVRPLIGLVRRLRAARTLVVHTHHIGQLLYGGLAARLVGARLVHTEHDFYSLDRPRARRLLRTLTTFADRVTAVAEPVRTFLETSVGVPTGKLVTIENGVEVERFERAVPVDRASLQCAPDHLVIGCIGRLSPEKGHAVLVDAFGHVRVRHPRARLVIAGDGEERTRLEADAARHGVREAVTFLGLRSDIPELLAACDVIVLPSLQEGFPMVVLEALAAGKALVASDVGAVGRVVDHEKTGLLVPPGHPTALADAMSLLIANRGLRESVGAAGRSLVRAQFDFRRTVAAYDDLYRTVLAGESRVFARSAPSLAGREAMTKEEQ